MPESVHDASLQVSESSHLIVYLYLYLYCDSADQLLYMYSDCIHQHEPALTLLVCRYLQAKHGQEKVHGYLSKIMTFVLNLLTNSY